eukprot:366546-Chlamydomonas_euryale.AAC.27
MRFSCTLRVEMLRPPGRQELSAAEPMVFSLQRTRALVKAEGRDGCLSMLLLSEFVSWQSAKTASSHCKVAHVSFLMLTIAG